MVDRLFFCPPSRNVLWVPIVAAASVATFDAFCRTSDSFLGCIPRIATRDYEPSNDDVLRARIRTLGVQEYHLVFENDGACLLL